MGGWTAGRREGSALVVVLGVLFVLAGLAISFARMTSLERDAATVKADEVQARFCALAGVERAIAEIGRASTRPWDGPDAPWFYRGAEGLAAGNSIPLGGASLPSFPAGNTRWGRAFSGALPETYEPEGDTYVLRVVDAASMIDLNAPADPRRPIGDEPLVRMLASLGRAIDPDRPPITEAEARMILAFRDTLPGRRYESKSQLLSIPGVPISEPEFERVAGFLTAHAWRDSTTIAPMDPALVPAAGDLVHGRVPTGTPVRSPRSPIDLNTAPVEVLTAAMADVSALRVDADVSRTPGPAWGARGLAARTAPVSLGAARALAGRIVSRRGSAPFRAWTDVRDLLAEAVAGGVVSWDQAAALYANADPNVGSHRANPDRVLWRPIDKFDLVVSTTEFGFASGGVFEIESIGRVTSGGGRIRAEARVRTVVTIYDVHRETTQSQFESGLVSVVERLEDQVYRLDQGILTGGSLRIFGSARLEGEGGAHAGGDLDLTGSPDVEGDATASGAYRQGPQAQVGGETGGGRDPVPIPTIRPADHRAQADFVFGADGTVTDRAGNVVGQGSFRDFTWQSGTGTWTKNGGDQTPGTYYFEGNVAIAGNSQGKTWRVTIIATGHVGVRGTPNYAPHAGSGITILAGSDVDIQGNPGARIEGLVYAGEQIQFGGNTVFHGPAIARDGSGSDPFVTGNSVSGSTILRYDGGFEVRGGVESHPVKTVSNYPDADATVDVGGQAVPLSELNSYDGYIGLSPIQTGRSVLGARPYRDRLLASWEGDQGLDADLGGGSLVLVPDRAGPVVAPLFSSAPPGHLLRDGLYSEFDAVGAYEALDNVGPLAGTIAFWFKPAWHGGTSPLATNGSHHLLSLSRTDGAGGTQSFQLAHAGEWTPSWSRVVGFHFERSAVENDRAQRLVYSSWFPPPHRWSHVAVVWDFLEADPDRAIGLFVDGVEVPGAVRDLLDAYALGPAEVARAAINQANLLRLGERAGADYELPAAGPDGTYDELVSLPYARDAAWAAARHAEGRYYSGPDAFYQSTVLPIPPGAEILHAAWTVRYPPGHAGSPVALVLREDEAPFASTTAAEGARVGHRVAGSIDYRVVFQGPAPAGGPLYETPIVDDVTLAIARDVRIHLWEE